MKSTQHHRNPVIPAKAGIHLFRHPCESRNPSFPSSLRKQGSILKLRMDSRFHGNDGADSCFRRNDVALRLQYLIIAFLSGALLPLAFAPVKWFLLAYICPALLLYLWLKSSPRAALMYGLVFGFGFFGVGASWIYISVHNYGNAGVFLAGFITAAFILLLSSCFALCGYLLRRIFYNASPAIICFLAFPALWVMCEWLRGWVFTGFPWLFLGYSQTQFILKNLAPVLSIYGVSLTVAFICGSLVWYCITPHYWKRFIPVSAIIATLFLSYVCSLFTWTTPVGKPISVALVQGNITLKMKWDQNYLLHILAVYKEQTEKHWNNGIIVWPEAAVPAITQQVAGYLAQINTAAKKHQSAIILGIPTYTTQTNNYFNSLLVLGNGSGVYNKRHLVPFGEYTPLGRIFQPLMKALGIPMSGFTAGAYNQPLLKVKNVLAAPFICYEIAYPLEVLSFARGSNFLVVVSDDSWFGNSFASAQQYQMAQMRAIETQRPILYATNSGISGIILANGSTQSALPINQLATLVSSFQPVSGETLVMRTHNLIVFGLIMMMLVLALVFM